VRVWVLVPLIAVALLLAGSYGSYAYVHNYDLYRGFPPPSEPAGIPHGTLVHVHFHSRALGHRRSYLIYLPPGYRRAAAEGRRYPVLYLLHAPVGQGRNYVQTGGLDVRVDKLLARHRMRPFITVIPIAHSPFGTDHEWANTSSGPYESFVLDTVRAVDARWATRRDRADRMLAGLSAGAYGAVNITLHHLATFGSFESWSGYFTQTPTDAFKGASRALLHFNDPTRYLPTVAGQLRRLGLHAYLYQGVHDDVPVSDMLAFAHQLRADGAHVRTAVYAGKHNWTLWRARFSPMLEYAGKVLGRRP
jgi:enterochelin esterase-like enzyme